MELIMLHEIEIARAHATGAASRDGLAMRVACTSGLGSAFFIDK
jgi:hypothetical protein